MMKFLRNKKGQGMSEYLIILALVAIATIGAVIFFADNVREQISNLAEEIAGVGRHRGSCGRRHPGTILEICPTLSTRMTKKYREYSEQVDLRDLGMRAQAFIPKFFLRHPILG